MYSAPTMDERFVQCRFNAPSFDRDKACEEGVFSIMPQFYWCGQFKDNEHISQKVRSYFYWCEENLKDQKHPPKYASK
jgi:hypothetical protein